MIGEDLAYSPFTIRDQYGNDHEGKYHTYHGSGTYDFYVTFRQNSGTRYAYFRKSDHQTNSAPPPSHDDNNDHSNQRSYFSGYDPSGLYYGEGEIGEDLAYSPFRIRDQYGNDHEGKYHNYHGSSSYDFYVTFRQNSGTRYIYFRKSDHQTAENATDSSPISYFKGKDSSGRYYGEGMIGEDLAYSPFTIRDEYGQDHEGNYHTYRGSSSYDFYVTFRQNSGTRYLYFRKSSNEATDYTPSYNTFSGYDTSHRYYGQGEVDDNYYGTPFYIEDAYGVREAAFYPGSSSNDFKVLVPAGGGFAHIYFNYGNDDNTDRLDGDISYLNYLEEYSYSVSNYYSSYNYNPTFGYHSQYYGSNSNYYNYNTYSSYNYYYYNPTYGYSSYNYYTYRPTYSYYTYTPTYGYNGYSNYYTPTYSYYTYRPTYTYYTYTPTYSYSYCSDYAYTYITPYSYSYCADGDIYVEPMPYHSNQHRLLSHRGYSYGGYSYRSYYGSYSDYYNPSSSYQPNNYNPSSSYNYNYYYYSSYQYRPSTSYYNYYNSYYNSYRPSSYNYYNYYYSYYSPSSNYNYYNSYYTPSCTYYKWVYVDTMEYCNNWVYSYSTYPSYSYSYVPSYNSYSYNYYNSYSYGWDDDCNMGIGMSGNYVYYYYSCGNSYQPTYWGSGYTPDYGTFNEDYCTYDYDNGYYPPSNYGAYYGYDGGVYSYYNEPTYYYGYTYSNPYNSYQSYYNSYYPTYSTYYYSSYYPTYYNYYSSYNPTYYNYYGSYYGTYSYNSYYPTYYYSYGSYYGTYTPTYSSYWNSYYGTYTPTYSYYGSYGYSYDYYNYGSYYGSYSYYGYSYYPTYSYSSYSPSQGNYYQNYEATYYNSYGSYSGYYTNYQTYYTDTYYDYAVDYSYNQNDYDAIFSYNSNYASQYDSDYYSSGYSKVSTTSYSAYYYSRYLDENEVDASLESQPVATVKALPDPTSEFAEMTLPEEMSLIQGKSSERRLSYTPNYYYGSSYYSYYSYNNYYRPSFSYYNHYYRPSYYSQTPQHYRPSYYSYYYSPSYSSYNYYSPTYHSYYSYRPSYYSYTYRPSYYSYNYYSPSYHSYYSYRPSYYSYTYRPSYYSYYYTPSYYSYNYNSYYSYRPSYYSYTYRPSYYSYYYSPSYYSYRPSYYSYRPSYYSYTYRPSYYSYTYSPSYYSYNSYTPSYYSYSYTNYNNQYEMWGVQILRQMESDYWRTYNKGTINRFKAFIQQFAPACLKNSLEMYVESICNNRYSSFSDSLNNEWVSRLYQDFDMGMVYQDTWEHSQNLETILSNMLYNCASSNLRNKASLVYGFTFKTFVGATGDYAKITVPQEYIDGMANCQDIKDLLVEFRVQPHQINSNDLQFTTNGLQNCKDLRCLAVQIQDTSKPGEGWFDLKAIFRSPNGVYSSSQSIIDITRVYVKVEFGNSGLSQKSQQRPVEEILLHSNPGTVPSNSFLINIGQDKKDSVIILSSSNSKVHPVDSKIRHQNMGNGKIKIIIDSSQKTTLFFYLMVAVNPAKSTGSNRDNSLSYRVNEFTVSKRINVKVDCDSEDLLPKQSYRLKEIVRSQLPASKKIIYTKRAYSDWFTDRNQFCRNKVYAVKGQVSFRGNTGEVFSTRDLTTEQGLGAYSFAADGSFVIDMNILTQDSYKFYLVAEREDGKKAVQEFEIKFLSEEQAATQTYSIVKPQMVPGIRNTVIDYDVYFIGETMEAQTAVMTFSTSDPQLDIVTASLTDQKNLFSLEGSSSADTWRVQIDQTKTYSTLEQAQYSIAIVLDDGNGNQNTYNNIINVIKHQLGSTDSEQQQTSPPVEPTQPTVQTTTQTDTTSQTTTTQQTVQDEDILQTTTGKSSILKEVKSVVSAEANADAKPQEVIDGMWNSFTSAISLRVVDVVQQTSTVPQRVFTATGNRKQQIGLQADPDSKGYYSPFEHSSQARMLQQQNGQPLTYADIDVTRDLADVQLLMKSDIDPRLVKYSVMLDEWTSHSLKFKFNFSDPMLLSRAEELDVMIMRLKNPERFVSKDTGIPLTKEQATFTYHIPKQLPQDADEAEIQKTADIMKTSMETLFVMTLFLMALLGVSLDALINCYLLLQIVCFLTIFNLDMPANVIIFLQTLRKVVQFNFVNMDSVMAFFGSDFRMHQIIDARVTPPVSNQELGIKTTDLWVNISTYLSVQIAVFAVWLTFKFIGIKSTFFKERAKRIGNNLAGFTIKWHQVMYLELVLAFLFNLQSTSNTQKAVGFILVLGTFVLYSNLIGFSRLGLLSKTSNYRIRALFNGMSEQNTSPFQSVYLPVFMARRFYLIWLPAFCFTSDSLKMLSIQYINAAFMSYYFSADPHVGRGLKRLFKLNEMVVFSFSYFLLYFTDFVRDPRVQYQSGTNMLYLICFTIFVNVVYNIWTVFSKIASRVRRRQLRKAYLQNLKDGRIIPKMEELISFEDLSDKVEDVVAYDPFVNQNAIQSDSNSTFSDTGSLRPESRDSSKKPKSEDLSVIHERPDEEGGISYRNNAPDQPAQIIQQEANEAIEQGPTPPLENPILFKPYNTFTSFKLSMTNPLSMKLPNLPSNCSNISEKIDEESVNSEERNARIMYFIKQNEENTGPMTPQKVMEKLGRQTTFIQSKVKPLVPQQQVQDMNKYRDTSNLGMVNRPSITGLLASDASPDKRSVFEVDEDKMIIEELIIDDDLTSNQEDSTPKDLIPMAHQFHHE